MKYFEITYHLRPEAENIVFTIAAKTFEDACVFAKQYRPESFSVMEVVKQEVAANDQ